MSNLDKESDSFTILRGNLGNVPLADTPEFIIFLRVTPLELRGMIKAEIPLFPRPPVRTAAVQ